LRWFVRRINHRVGHDHSIEEGRAFNPFATAAEGDLHEAVDVGLLRFDLFAKFGILVYLPVTAAGAILRQLRLANIVVRNEVNWDDLLG
jgi:hypothetical protein